MNGYFNIQILGTSGILDPLLLRRGSSTRSIVKLSEMFKYNLQEIVYLDFELRTSDLSKSLFAEARKKNLATPEFALTSMKRA